MVVVDTHQDSKTDGSEQRPHRRRFFPAAPPAQTVIRDTQGHFSADDLNFDDGFNQQMVF